MSHRYDYLIIGSGIMGLSLAKIIHEQKPNATIAILDKEKGEAHHASSRNSGVLHAGFYYTSDSLKAKLTIEGNRALKDYCRQKNIPVNECGKLVVAQNEEELQALYKLEERGRANGSGVRLIDAGEATEIEPNVRTHKKALYSPQTASVNPAEVCKAIRHDLEQRGVKFHFGTQFLSRQKNVVQTNQGDFEAAVVINCAGLYADRIARHYGFGLVYTMIPFKGIYLKYTKNKTDIRTNIYPVPNLKNPFLGVHFTKTAAGEIKIGPTAIPALWRENYEGISNFNASELGEIAYHQLLMFVTNANGFRRLAFEESRKYNKTYFIQLASQLVQSIDPAGFTEFTAPGIRAQLLNKKTFQLVQDFVVEGDDKSVHILNAVSPAFTCSFPFAKYVVEKYLK
ncbi:MAG: L-2-hydroxyglutarate oxidase [Candidatus Omnitrophota bacterium]|nr:L-2-hydroxyglutarate oxidase [Candidatus Omnitrophota bacterium]